MITWFDLQQDPWALISLIWLTMALLAWWFASHKIQWLCMIPLSLSLWFSGRMSIWAFGVMGCLFFCLHQSTHHRRIFMRRMSFLFAIVLSLACMWHLVPGVHNWLLVPGVQLSPFSISYRMYVNFDKPWVPLMAVLCLPWLKSSPITRSQLITCLYWGVPGLFMMIFASYLAHFITWDLKQVDGLIWWCWINFWLVCLPEEVLFRGMIQHPLIRWLHPLPHARYLGIGLSAVMFVVIHWPGGLTYVALATLGGVLYGIIYDKTAQIKLAILTHFTLNLIHINCFTYPAMIQP